MKMKKLIALLTAGVISGLSVFANAEVAVIAHPSVVGLEKQQVEKIFLGKIQRLPDGSKLVPIDQAQGNSTREVFYQALLGKSPDQMSTYWARLLFTGKGKPPKIIDRDEVVKALVAVNPNILAYIDKEAVDSSVQILFTLPK